VILDVPRENFRVGGLEHQMFNSDCADELGNYIASPGFHIFRDSLRFDHDHTGASVQERLRLLDRPGRIPRTFGLQFLRRGSATGAELNADFGLRLQAGLFYSLDQAKPIAGGNRDEAAGNFYDVEAEILALPDILADRFSTLPKHILEKAPGRDEDVV